MFKINYLLLPLLLMSCSKGIEMPNCMHDQTCQPQVQRDYLKKVCESNEATKQCCLASLNAMMDGGYSEATTGPAPCPEQNSLEMLRCQGSLRWCVPQ